MVLPALMLIEIHIKVGKREGNGRNVCGWGGEVNGGEIEEEEEEEEEEGEEEKEKEE